MAGLHFAGPPGHWRPPGPLPLALPLPVPVPVRLPLDMSIGFALMRRAAVGHKPKNTKKKKISKRKKHEPEEYQLVRNASFIPAAFKHSSNFCGLGLDFKVFRFCIKHAQQIPRTQIAVNSGSSLSKVFGLTIH